MTENINEILVTRLAASANTTKDLLELISPKDIEDELYPGGILEVVILGNVFSNIAKTLGIPPALTFSDIANIKIKEVTDEEMANFGALTENFKLKALLRMKEASDGYIMSLVADIIDELRKRDTLPEDTLFTIQAQLHSGTLEHERILNKIREVTGIQIDE